MPLLSASARDQLPNRKQNCFLIKKREDLLRIKQFIGYVTNYSDILMGSIRIEGKQSDKNTCPQLAVVEALLIQP